MAMKLYNIEDTLVGTYYRSPKHSWKTGVIEYAEKRDDVYVGEGYSAYLVEYRDPNSKSFTRNYATIVVAHN